MSLQKLLWAAMALCVTAGVAAADPMRTVFTKENKFPGAMGWDLSLAAGGSSFDGKTPDDDVSRYNVTPGVRFGLTDRLAVLANVPYAGYSKGKLDKSGLGDVELGTEFLFFEDIFEYAWIIPHATAILPTGDEDKMLGKGEGQGRFGISIGTTVNDVIHFALDGSYTANGAETPDENGNFDNLLSGALSIVCDLDERSSVLGEVQVRDDSTDPKDDYALRGHLGLAYKINKRLTLMGYVGSSSSSEVDFYGMGRLVCSF
jgi:hypothetical protein